MYRSKYLPAALLLTALAWAPVHLRADEDEAAELNEQPAAVQKTAHEQVGSNKIEEVEPTYAAGQHATEVEYTDHGKKMAVAIAKDGTLIQKEYRLSPSDTPAIIKTAISAQYPNGTISHIKEVERKDVKFYELSVKSSGKAHAIKLDESGKPIKVD